MVMKNSAAIESCREMFPNKDAGIMRRCRYKAIVSGTLTLELQKMGSVVRSEAPRHMCV